MSQVNEIVPARSATDANDTAPELPELDDAALAKARRGDFLPRDPVQRAARLEARVIALQKNGLALREENERLRVLLAWALGQLSEAEAARRLDVDRRTLGEYRAAALAASMAPGA